MRRFACRNFQITTTADANFLIHLVSTSTDYLVQILILEYLYINKNKQMELRKFIATTIREHLNENVDEYLKWKRKNVTLRGIKEFGKTNEVYGSFGKGLYTVPLSNKAMAKQYGDVYFVVNAIPKTPKIVDSLNNAELLRQKLINDFCKKHNKDYNIRFFESNTTMEDEMLNLGYDGLIIKSREMVNYTPNDVKYFETENELQRYYEALL